MKRLLVVAVRALGFALAVAGLVYLALHLYQQSSWHKNRLHHRLLTGNPREQLQAASMLAYLWAEPQLLAGLKAESATARDMARRALEYTWFNAAGPEAYQLLQAAYQADQAKDLDQALALATKLVEKFPGFAEGWNRRAAVLWQMGDHQNSIKNSEMALTLNPNHYGAWQGLGVCRLQLGEISEACRCLRAALNIIPFDQATLDSLRRCETLLPTRRQPVRQAKTHDML